MHIDELDAKERGYGSYPVSIIPHFLIPVRDGTRLAAKLYFPVTNPGEYGFDQVDCATFFNPNEGVQLDNFPAEYIPYRKSDYTAERDHLRHPWTASHGYVVLRVDLRGSGMCFFL